MLSSCVLINLRGSIYLTIPCFDVLFSNSRHRTLNWSSQSSRRRIWSSVVDQVGDIIIPMHVYNRKQTPLPCLITSIIIYLFIYLFINQTLLSATYTMTMWPTLHIEFIEFTLIVWHIQFNPHHMIINGGTEAGIQPLLRRILRSNVSSLIHSVWRKWRYQVTKVQTLASIPWMDNCLMVTGPLVVELTLVKCHWWLFVYNGANFEP